MRIAVVGGTGLIGRHVVEEIASSGNEAVPLSRSTGVDVTTGDGLVEALAGVDRVVDVTNSGTTEEGPATEFFTAAARNLQAAAEQAGVERLAVLSIVGTDRVPGGYFAAKVAHELAARAGAVPTIVVRATQFHEFAGQVLEWGRDGDVSHVQRMQVQPVAVRSAARALVEFTLTSAADTVEIAGPRPEELLDMATRVAARRGEPDRVEPVADDSPVAAATESGALLPGPDAIIVGPTFAEWLDAGEQAP